MLEDHCLQFFLSYQKDLKNHQHLILEEAGNFAPLPIAPTIISGVADFLHIFVSEIFTKSDESQI